MTALTVAAVPPLHWHAVTAHVVPWDRMTPRQQAEHLVHAHGLDGDYFDLQGIVNTAAAVDAWLTFRPPIAPDESYAHPAGRTDWHDGDHDAREGYFPHEHDKTTDR